MIVTCSKEEAAARQLDVAIGLLFTDADPLAIRTLAGAAYGILADLAETALPGESWRTKLIQDSGLKKEEAFRIINSAQNYLKHADRDAHSRLSFNEEENDQLLFVASLERGGVQGSLSYAMQAYQIWYLAKYPDRIGRDSEPVRTSRKVFPDLASRPRIEQLALGHEFLEMVLLKKGVI